MSGPVPEFLNTEHVVATASRVGDRMVDGDDVIIAGSASDEQAKELLGDWRAPRPYIRVVPQPNGSER